VDVSTGLIKKLPLLINRFGSKPETAAQILRMVQCVKLDKYHELRQLGALEELLEDVGKQLMNHTDEGVFREASASLLHAQTFELLGHITEPKIIELQDEVNTGFLSTVNGKVSQSEMWINAESRNGQFYDGGSWRFDYRGSKIGEFTPCYGLYCCGCRYEYKAGQEYFHDVENSSRTRWHNSRCRGN
jgi:hypothetical protein